MAGQSAKEIFSGGADNARGGILDGAIPIAANDHHGSASGFAHEKTGGGGEFIGDGKDRGAEKLAMAVARAAKIDESGNAGCADGDVGEAEAPGAAEGVADDDGEALAGSSAKSGGEAAGGAIGIFGQERDEIAAGDVRMVDACIGADETVMSFNDEDALRANDAAGLAQNGFDETRIVRHFFGEGDGLGGRLDI